MDARQQAAWREADRILDRLLDLAPGEREAALDAATDDPEVRRLTRRLLAAHARLIGPLDAPPPAPDVAPAAVDALAGTVLGRWRLLREIGRGGMATVYRAESTALPAGQLAAVKVLTLGALAAGGRERFLREQELLARLRTPGIAPLYDAGVAADGTPWLAMMLVDGERIDAWCHARGADLATRVALLVQVAQALGDAHRNLVVHRDIKPSNVLVEGSGRVWLLDFGIARLVDELEPERTSTALRALTPQYAAPEQFAGGAPSTAMDVYGLGALAYRLLAGQSPRPGSDGTPLPPSRAVHAAGLAPGLDAARWARALRGDLDTVLLKALATQPAQRYASAEAFAEDLQRWRQRRPLRARAPGVGYRLRRFVARHRWGVAAAAGFVLVGLLASAQILQQRSRAAAEAARAEIVRDFLAEVLVASDPSEGDVPDALDLLRAGSERARGTLRERQPLAAADVLTITGSARLALNDLDGAEADLLAAAALLDALPSSPPLRSRLHDSLGRLYKLRGSRKSLDHHRRAAEWFAQWPAPAHEQLANEVSLAAAESRFGEMEAAERLLRQALARASALELEGTQTHLDALNALTSLLARREAPLDERIALHERRMRAARTLYGEHNGWYAYTLADSVPTLRRSRDALPRAETVAREAVAIAERVYAQPHMFAAVAHCNLAALLMQQGRMAEALPHYDRAIGIDAALGRVDLHSQSCRYGRAYVHAARGHADAAHADLEHARGMLGTMERWRSADWLQACALDVRLLVQQGRTADAATQLTRCDRENRPEGDAPALAFDLAAAEVEAVQGRWDLAERRLARLRTQWDPGEPTRRWLRPWLLSHAVARGEADAGRQARLELAMRPHLFAEPAAADCLASTAPLRCLPFP